jgi:hypothetical protein
MTKQDDPSDLENKINTSPDKHGFGVSTAAPATPATQTNLAPREGDCQEGSDLIFGSDQDELKNFSETRSKGYAKSSKKKKTPTSPISLFDLLNEEVGFEHDYLQSCRPSPFENLNKCLQGGFRSGEVYSFFGHSGVGKSTFLMSLMAKLAQEDFESLTDSSYSYLYLDKEYSSKEFYAKMIYGGMTVEEFTKADLKNQYDQIKPHDPHEFHTAQDVAEFFPTLYHQQFDEKHQSGYYHYHISNMIEKLPHKNVRIIFFDGVQDETLLSDLKEVAVAYDCAVITTSTLKRNYGKIPDTLLQKCAFAGVLRQKAEIDIKNEPEGSHRLYIIKSRFLNNDDFTGMITVKTPYGKKLKKSNYLLFDINPSKTFQGERVKEKGTLLDTLSCEDIVEPKI